jgi:sortase (surface protein transpeptidase)
MSLSYFKKQLQIIERNDSKVIVSLVVVILISIVMSLLITPREVTIGFRTISAGGNSTQSAQGLVLGDFSANGLPQILASSQTQDFRLVIPKIGLSHKVVENVDPASESVYGPVINEFIAHGMYTRLPDEAVSNGNVYLFAHREGSYQGNNIGYFNQLDKVTAGDTAEITYAGKRYVYEFWRNFVITPQDTWVYNGESNFPMLTLQTCENGLAARLIVQFRLKEVGPA